MPPAPSTILKFSQTNNTKNTMTTTANTLSPAETRDHISTIHRLTVKVHNDLTFTELKMLKSTLDAIPLTFDYPLSRQAHNDLLSRLRSALAILARYTAEAEHKLLNLTALHDPSHLRF